MRTPLVFSLLAALSLVATGCSDYTDRFDGTSTNGNLLTGTGGGSIKAQPGSPVAGTKLDIPAQALSAPAFITVGAGTVVPEAGWMAVGPAAAWSPAGLRFDVPATLTLPFDPASIPAGAADTDLRVKFVDANGNIQTLIPTSIDRASGLVTVPITQLGTYWVSAPFVDPNQTTADLREYLPLNLGDRYEYDTGFTINVEPGINNDPSLAYVDNNLGVLRVESTLFQNDGTLVTNGWTGRIYQFDMATPLVRAPAMPTFGQQYTASSPWTLTIPPGSAVPAATGMTDLIGEVQRVPVQEALATTGFADVLQLATVRTWSVDGFGVFEEELDFVWLARNVGPVLFEDSTAVRHVLTSATVAGQTVVGSSRN